jgi:hypothetical protein
VSNERWRRCIHAGCRLGGLGRLAAVLCGRSSRGGGATPRQRCPAAGAGAAAARAREQRRSWPGRRWRGELDARRLTVGISPLVRRFGRIVPRWSGRARCRRG